MSVPIPKFVCKACRHPHNKWEARCLACGAWDLEPNSPRLSLVTPIVQPPPPPTEPAPKVEFAEPEPEPAPIGPPKPRRLSDIRAETYVKLATGIEPVDAVLGGGVVEGFSILLAAPPGAGKSTLVLQVLQALDLPSLYVSAEEPISHIGERARRLRLTAEQVDLISVTEDTQIETIFADALSSGARIVVIDSIQKMVSAELDAREGTPGQVKLCASRILKFGHKHRITMLVIGQMNGEDKIAGPRALEHEVDVLLELEPLGKTGTVIKLRCLGKNRGGAKDVVGRFKMTSNGLAPLKEGERHIHDDADPGTEDEDDDEPNIH